ncbi:MAG TPA: glycosyltransferase family 4 protein [Gaiellaceae bacterium]|nr:glycosyltransferase family 4 protein [Gaiellaceae bacterium]
MSGKPEVAVVAHGVHEGGGMERALYELIARGAPRFRFVVLAAELDERLLPLVEWRRIRTPMRPIPLKILVFAAAAGLALRRRRPALVHTLGAVVPNRADLASVHFCATGLAAATGRNAPRDGSFLRRANTALTRLLARAGERRCYRPGRVRALAAVSPGEADELRRHFPAVDVTVTPNGIDTARYRPDPAARAAVRAELGVADDAPVVLFVGGDWHHKGVALVLEGAARAGVPLRVWVVGRGDAARFGRLARRLGVDATFLGVRPDVERFFAAADVYCMASLYETFSIAAHEAAASGLPVVSTRVHGVAELVGDEEAGILVARDAESIGAALARLAADPDLRARLGAEGRRRAEAFTWERSAESVLALYDRLLRSAA